ncbi:MAG TPA: DMT family transporter [Candidatus Sulfotelmatobacter sp.]|nr:DMT family transporter [Candidatus Sulfotelmatobacter sp.]
MAETTSYQDGVVWTSAALAFAGCLWGTGFLFGKIAFREMTVAENVSYRFVCACVVLIPILFRKRESFRRRDFGLLVVAAIIGVPVQFLLQFKGLQLTTVSHASLIVGTLPVLVALASAVFLGERLDALAWAVLLLSPAGVFVIALSARKGIVPTGGPTLTGDLLVLVSMLAAVVMILITKRLTARYNSLQITAWSLVIGAVLLVGWTECVDPVRFHFSTAVWSAAAAQGLLATAGAYLFWNWGLSRLPASRAGVFLNLEPLVGTILGVVVLHETLGLLAILGGGMILGPAIYFSRRS